MAVAFSQVNVVVADMDATVAFYRLVGLDVPDAPEWPPGSGARHTEIGRADGCHIAFDNTEMSRIWGASPGSPAPPPGTTVVIGLAVENRDAVDDRCAAAEAAGYGVARPPYDAFWGARYAIVVDPDGHHVGLMSPVDPAARYTPEPPGS